jgi:hypothetical protein
MENQPQYTHLPDDISQPKIEQEEYTSKRTEALVDLIIPTPMPAPRTN